MHLLVDVLYNSTLQKFLNAWQTHTLISLDAYIHLILYSMNILSDNLEHPFGVMGHINEFTKFFQTSWTISMNLPNFVELHGSNMIVTIAVHKSMIKEIYH